MPNANIAVDESPFDVELRKAVAESGWNLDSEKVVLLRFIAYQARLRASTLSEFKMFLRDQLAQEAEAVAFPRLAADADEEEDEDDEEDDDEDDDDDFDDDFDDDLDDDEDDDEDDFDDEFDDDLDDDEDDDDEDDEDDDEDDGP